VDIATGSLLGMLTPLLNVAVGVFAFGESLRGVELAGAALVLAACGLALAPVGRRGG
jgi:drug/metabolite transporter (DMT)-like permease